MAYITFGGVDFRYGLDDPLIIRNFNLELERGELFTLVGPSGCGKTTVLHMLAGFESPSAGVPPGRRAPGARAAARSHRDLPGARFALPLAHRARERRVPLRVMGVPRAERRSRAEEALRLVGLHGHGEKHPGHLSGGMKQRIQLARALVLDAPVLLMDEPFAALDAQTRQILQEELVQIAARTQRTILFITHDIQEAIFLGRPYRP
jgi:NitT/TauT family transport system ATP-binding protein